jgi:hypothetical protein
MDLDMQCDLFAAVLDEIESDGDLVNTVLEATLRSADSEEIEIARYRIPGV